MRLKFKKEKFVEVYNKYAPSKLEKFFYKYFSNQTTQKYNYIITAILLIPFFIGLIGTIGKAPDLFIRFITICFTVEMLSVGFLYIIIYSIHKKRINNIIKQLNCSREEYEHAINMWGNELK